MTSHVNATCTKDGEIKMGSLVGFQHKHRDNRAFLGFLKRYLPSQVAKSCALHFAVIFAFAELPLSQLSQWHAVDYMFLFTIAFATLHLPKANTMYAHSDFWHFGTPIWLFWGLSPPPDTYPTPRAQGAIRIVGYLQFKCCYLQKNYQKFPEVPQIRYEQ